MKEHVFIIIKVKRLLLLIMAILLVSACSHKPVRSSYIPPIQWLKDINHDCLMYNPKPVANEKISWSGECFNGYASGKGSVQWYKNGKPTSKYRATYFKGKDCDKTYCDDKTVLSSSKKLQKKNYSMCFSGDCRNGIGIYNEYGYVNNISVLLYKYEGEFKNGKKHGKGRLTTLTPWYKKRFLKESRPLQTVIGTWNKGRQDGAAIHAMNYDMKNKKFRRLVPYFFSGSMKRKISLGEIITAGVTTSTAKRALKNLDYKRNLMKQYAIDKENARKQAIINKENARKQAIINKENARKQAVIDKENARKKAIFAKQKVVAPSSLPYKRSWKIKRDLRTNYGFYERGVNVICTPEGNERFIYYNPKKSKPYRIFWRYESLIDAVQIACRL